MTTFKIITILISFSALIVSICTAYFTLFSRFQIDFFLQPRIILTRYENQLSIVICCEIINKGAKSGIINDIVLSIKNRHKNSVNKTIFLPKFLTKNYNLLKERKENFEQFQSIAVSGKTQISTFIVFCPSEDINFSDGIIELTLYSLSPNKNDKWCESKNQVSFEINKETITDWKESDDANQIEAEETRSHRNILAKGLLA